SGYFAAELQRSQGPGWVVVGAAQYSKDKIVVRVDVSEGRAMEEGLGFVDADAMARGRDADGRIALYGIHFDHDKATLRAESDQTLGEIAKLLTSRPKLRVFIVGYTDGVGTLEYNLGLSSDRAKTVAEALVMRHGIDRSRLDAR